MENNTSAVVNEASTPSATESAQPLDYSALAGRSFKEAAAHYADSMGSESASLDTDTPSDGANPSESVSDTDESRRLETAETPAENKHELSPGIKKRIDGLQGRLKTEQEAHRSMALENARLTRALAMYDGELKRVSSLATLDPQAERIRSLELERQIDEVERTLPGEVEERFSAREQEYALAERQGELLADIKHAHNQWDGVFTVRELAIYMKQSGNVDATSAANALGEARMEAVSKRTKSAPPSPSTASGRGNGSRDLAEPWRYRGASTIADFLDNEARSKAR